MTSDFALPAHEDIRTILAADFPSRGPLPICGGWGYTRETACIIDKHDPSIPPGVPFDGVRVEYEFVARRLWEEMIIFRAPGEKFAGIEWELTSQRTTVIDGRRYDRLCFHVTALPKALDAELSAEWEANLDNLDFDLEAHLTRRTAAQVHRDVEYWFDITSYYPVQRPVSGS